MIERRQNPATFLRNAAHIRDYVKREKIDVLHTHLTHDHTLALWAARGSQARVVRTFRSRRAFRRNLLTRMMIQQTDGICVVNAAFQSYETVKHRDPQFTPPPVDHRIFTPGRENARNLYGVDSGTTVVGVIGKIAPQRGFEDAVETFRLIRKERPGAKLLIVGKGTHRAALEEFSRANGTADDVIWSGYQDGGLVPHFRAMNVLLFTATGSDEGHRATTEALASGTRVAAWPIRGVRALLSELSDEMVSSEQTHQSLADRACELLDGGDDLSRKCVELTGAFDLEKTARRLQNVYARVLEGHPSSKVASFELS